MMKILTPDNTGFCFGVNRAIRIAEGVLMRNKPAYIYGELIHNKTITAQLEQKGLSHIEDIDKAKGGILIIRAHGVAPGIRGRIEEKNIEIVDATCPIVRQAQLAAKSLEDEGYQVIIVGDNEHAEIKGIVGHLKKNPLVVSSSGEVKPGLIHRKVGVIFQTTHSIEFCKEVISEIMKSASEIKIINTLCGHIRKRQEEAADIAKKSDMVIVVGGRHSSNTIKLKNICLKYNKRTMHIESAREIKPSRFRNIKTVGIVGGASTPEFIIEEVKEKLRCSVSRRTKRYVK